ncbi:hypothetical protein SARC_04460 [Sphaeroforma arctica JP610]|uniref:Uncharacterized protein n=1 Tax=Sphaeroforma arctica JP610 TaxID=667725 RepID=A0A0L0G365_9EUKA|nr:hypothetical protein SARC_04460 [Sphaeroforma arctica JP610]KNC83281.1 hypothetical protein SARC_04460 [Sphaeroforma arctica JP610]|eukprot:XP_014157183.1 hypothetical protein SARC_04460 [Sphaeroforma arctica JP610]
MSLLLRTLKFAGRGRKDSKEKKNKGKKDKPKPKSKNDLALRNSQSCIEMGGSATTGIAVCTPDGTGDESDTDFFTMLKEDPPVRPRIPRGSSTPSPRFSRRWASDDDVLVNHHMPKNSSTLSTHHSNTTTTTNNNNNNTLEPIGTPKTRSRSSSTGSRFRAMSSGGSGTFRAMALRAVSPFEGSGSKPTHTTTGTGTGTDHSPSPPPTHHSAQLHHASSDGSPRAHPHTITQPQGKTMHTHARTHAQASRQTTNLQAFSWAEFLEKVTDPAHATNNHATSVPFRDTHAHARRYTEGSAVSNNNNNNSANGAASPHTTRHTVSGDTRSGVAALRDPHSLPTLTAPALDAPRSLPAIGVERDPMLCKGSVVLAKFANLRSDGDTTPTESEAQIISHPRMGVTTAQRALVQKTWTTV